MLQMPDKHSDTDEVEKILNSLLSFSPSRGSRQRPDGTVRQLTGAEVREEARAAILNLLTSEKRKLLERLKALPSMQSETEYANLDGDAGYWEKHGRNGLRTELRAELEQLGEL